MSIFIGVIGVGIFYSLPKEEPVKVYKENRNYKLVITQPANTIADPQLTKEDFGKTAKDIGFEEVTCHEKICIAKHDTYKEKTYHIIHNITQHNSICPMYLTYIIIQIFLLN